MLALAAMLLAAGCQTTTSAGAVGVERKQMMMVSSQEVDQASEKQYDQIIAEAKQKNLLNRDAKMVTRVLTVADRLIPQVKVFREDAVSWAWEVNVITSDDLNAWCMAGGKIAFYSGIINKLELTDAEIAAIMGHEMAHALREHSREQISRSMMTATGLSVAGALLGLGSGTQNLMSMVTKVTFELPNSREHETEADRIGVELAARGGYDPRAAIALWQKMAQASSGSAPQWLSTHPSHENRQKNLAVYAERVMPLYEAARKK